MYSIWIGVDQGFQQGAGPPGYLPCFIASMPRSKRPVRLLGIDVGQWGSGLWSAGIGTKISWPVQLKSLISKHFLPSKAALIQTLLQISFSGKLQQRCEFPWITGQKTACRKPAPQLRPAPLQRSSLRNAASISSLKLALWAARIMQLAGLRQRIRNKLLAAEARIGLTSPSTWSTMSSTSSSNCLEWLGLITHARIHALVAYMVQVRCR